MIFHTLLDDTKKHQFLVAYTAEHIAKKVGMSPIARMELASLIRLELIEANGPIEDPETRYSLHLSVDWGY